MVNYAVTLHSFILISGVSEPRLSASGDELPSARKVSTDVFTHNDVTEPAYTALNSHFGQFLDHDIGHTPTEIGISFTSSEINKYTLLPRHDQGINRKYCNYAGSFILITWMKVLVKVN